MVGLVMIALTIYTVAPTRPPTPHVTTPHGNDKNVQVDLFETDNQYGPIR